MNARARDIGPSSVPTPLTRQELEAAYYAVIDFMSVPEHRNPRRVAELVPLVSRLADHVRWARASVGATSGVRRRVDPRSIVQKKLLAERPPEEEAVWAIYGEQPDPNGDLGLLTIMPGRWSEVVERALDMPEFITCGMGGRIDPLGE